MLLDRSLRLSEHETALEVGWLLAELEQRFGYGLDELARRFDRSGELDISASGAGGGFAASNPTARARSPSWRGGC